MKDLRFYSNVGYLTHNDNIFTHILRKKYNLIIDNINPELSIVDSHKEHKNTISIRFTGEAEMNIYNNDYCICPFYINDERYFRIPLYQVHIYEMIRLGYATFDTFFEKKNFTKEILEQKNKFCCFMYLHASLPRDTLFTKLSQYKFVDSPGERFNKFR